MAETMPNESSVVEIASEMDQSVEDKVTIEMEEMIRYCGDGGFMPECCIYRVPIVLRELKKNAYTPKVVSIGPFHRKNMKLKGMGKMTKQNSSLEAQNHFGYNANALQEAGIKFKASESKCLLDWKFSGHTLEIPQMDVDDTTEILFQNMIALEQCHYLHASYITEYTAMMDWLIDTNEDVDILIHNNIVCNNLGDSKSVALTSLFNGLGKNVFLTSFNADYFEICKMLNEYCQNPWHKKKAILRRDYCNTLRRDYCNTPWRTVASVAGIILLLLTIAQTIFPALQVY